MRYLGYPGLIGTVLTGPAQGTRLGASTARERALCAHDLVT
jgi:hypothetical protein